MSGLNVLLSQLAPLNPPHTAGKAIFGVITIFGACLRLLEGSVHLSCCVNWALIRLLQSFVGILSCRLFQHSFSFVMLAFTEVGDMHSFKEFCFWIVSSSWSLTCFSPCCEIKRCHEPVCTEQSVTERHASFPNSPPSPPSENKMRSLCHYCINTRKDLNARLFNVTFCNIWYFFCFSWQRE